MPDELTPESSAALLARWREGDQRAASELWQRYAVRLVALARSRMSQQMASQLDPEDVVQSVYRRFFANAKDDRYVLRQSGDLWRLLVAITLHRVQDQHRRQSARKRALGEPQQLLRADGSIEIPLLAQEPSPDQAAMVTDELELVLRGLEPAYREMVKLRLEGYHIEEIAAQTGKNERTVRRLLKEIQRRLRLRCQEYTTP